MLPVFVLFKFVPSAAAAIELFSTLESTQERFGESARLDAHDNGFVRFNGGVGQLPQEKYKIY